MSSSADASHNRKLPSNTSHGRTREIIYDPITRNIDTSSIYVVHHVSIQN